MDEKLERGFVVWTVAQLPSRSLDEDHSEGRCLRIVFDDERFDVEKTGKHWTVEILHHRYRFVNVTSGWGNTRRITRVLRTRQKSTERKFHTEEEARAFAARIAEVFQRVRAAKERDDS